MTIETLPDRKPSLLLPNTGGNHYETQDVSIDIHNEMPEIYFISPKEIIGFPIARKPIRIIRAFDSDAIKSEYLMPDTMGFTAFNSQTYARVRENQENEGKLLVMNYDPSFRRAIEQEMPKRRVTLRSDHNIPIPFSTKILFQSILRFVTNGHQGGKLVAESLVTMAIVHTLKIFDKDLKRKSVTSNVLKNQALDRTLEFIEANLNRNIGLREISDVTGINLFHLLQCFKRAVGETPHAYLTKRRVERAKDMLANTNKPLNEIALACGFLSQSHLSTTFRQKTGLPPSRYRLEARR